MPIESLGVEGNRFGGDRPHDDCTCTSSVSFSSSSLRVAGGDTKSLQPPVGVVHRCSTSTYPQLMPMQSKGRKIVYVCLAAAVWHIGMQWANLLFPYLQWEVHPPLDMVDIGVIHAVGSLSNMVGAFMIGEVIDNYGCQLCFFLSAIVTGGYYVLLSQVTSYHGFLLAQTLRIGFHFDHITEIFISTVTTESERTAALLKMGLPIGVSTIVGPWVAGRLTVAYNLRFAQFVNGVFTTVGILPIIYLISDVHGVPRIHLSKLRFHNYLSMLSNDRLLKCVAMRASLLVPLICYEMVSRQYLIRTFFEKANDATLLFCILGLSILFTNFYAIRKLQQHFKPKFVMQMAVGVLIFSYASLPLISSTLQLIFVMTLQTIGYSVALSEAVSQLTTTVEKSELGKATGLATSLHWLLHCTIPLIAGYVLQTWGHIPLSLGAAVVSGIALYAITEYGQFMNRHMGDLPFMLNY
ncbi:unnamed protein product [Soboliphyme baturini]|uniref:MFS domain-containing protein n=1 Tax=Soboliphyme baturini TaxID=241478 RepID=A0A183IYL2_9BILA|nr:unnamed protein product [Soboliphyme baturini]